MNCIPSCLLLIVLCLTQVTQAHTGSINLFVDTDNNQIYPLENFEIAQLRKFLAGQPGEEISVDGPGFMVAFPANGVIPNSLLKLTIEQDLLYWDGVGLAPTDVTFQLGAPLFDNQGVNNTTPVTEYNVTAASGKQSGMQWGNYNGLNFWEAHGLNFLLELDAAPGVYSVAARIVTENHLDSNVFAIPFVYDPDDLWDPLAEQVGIDRARQATAAFDLADVNADGHVNTTDIDLVVADIAAGLNSPQYDLTGDGLVTDKDLSEWRAVAGTATLPLANTFIQGDANLDGIVDVSDFNIWNSNKFSTTAAWSLGDFNANGVVDVSDYNIWNSNKFSSALDSHGDGFSAPVPEPGPWTITLALVLFSCPVLRAKL